MDDEIRISQRSVPKEPKVAELQYNESVEKTDERRKRVHHFHHCILFLGHTSVLYVVAIMFSHHI